MALGLADEVSPQLIAYVLRSTTDVWPTTPPGLPNSPVLQNGPRHLRRFRPTHLPASESPT
ncbi:hypothetical protein BGY98DRAFT_985651, partial [Russula aff. rugulosa BPL654]